MSKQKTKNVRNTITGKLSLFCNFKTLNKNLRNDKMDQKRKSQNVQKTTIVNFILFLTGLL